MKKIIASILAAFFVLLSPLSAFASTTEQIYSVQPMGIYEDYSLDIYPALYDIDDSSGTGGTPTLISTPVINWTNGITSSQLRNFSGVYNFDDYYFGYRLRLYNNNPYGVGIPTLFKSSLNLDFGFYRHFIQYNGTNYDLSPGAVPVVAYAVINGLYNYNYTNDSGSTSSSYDNSFSMRVPIDVYNHDFYPQNYEDYLARYFINIRLNGFTLDDMILAENSGRNTGASIDNLVNYYNTGRIKSFSASTNSVDFYIFYDFSSFVNLNTDSSAYLPIGSDLSYRFYSGYTSASEFPSSLNLTYDTYQLNDSVSFSDNIFQGLSLLSSRLVSNMGSIVENATDNANRIIQNTTNKINEVKEGITDVKDSVVETKNSILDLPNKIKDMLLGLIVPSSETMSNKFTEFSELLEDKLGIIYQVPMMLFDFFDTIVNAATTPQTTLTLPAFQLPWIDGTTLTVWQPMEYRIIPEGMQVLSDLIKTITSMTVVVLTFNSVKRAYERFLRS